VLPLSSCFSSISVSERLFLASVAKKLSNDSVVVEVGSLLGGNAAILAHANKNINVQCIESFEGSAVQSHFNSLSKWIEEQLIDVCKGVGALESTATDHLASITTALDQDASGKTAWVKNTSKYNNITLGADDVDSIDVCLIKNPNKDILESWSSRLRIDGQMIIHDYGISQDFAEYISANWYEVNRKDNLVVLRKR
jgi:protein-L-isoaspartate O-methyltransferase